MPDDLGKVDEEQKPSVSMEAVEKLVESFKETVQDVANRPVNVTVESPNQIEDVGTKQAALTEKYNAIKEQANELGSQGDMAGAMELMYSFIQEQASTNRPDPSKDPAVKSLMSMGKQLAKQTYSKEFEKYGDEIAEYVNGLSAEQKINPEIWTEAVGTIRTRHFDEVLEDAIKERTANEKSIRGDMPPVAGAGRRTRTKQEGTTELSADEQGVADSFGMSNEKYTEQKEIIEKHSKRGVFPILETEDLKTVEPGKF